MLKWMFTLDWKRGENGWGALIPEISHCWRMSQVEPARIEAQTLRVYSWPDSPRMNFPNIQ